MGIERTFELVPLTMKEFNLFDRFYLGCNLSWSTWNFGWSNDFDGMRIVHVGPLKLFNTRYEEDFYFDDCTDIILVWVSDDYRSKIDLLIWPLEFKVGFEWQNGMAGINLGFLSFRCLWVTGDKMDHLPLANPPLFKRRKNKGR